jgi:phosphoribosyl 1,2-cyclic phosphate phosphodiesterase
LFVKFFQPVFVQPPGSAYPSILELCAIEDRPFEVPGVGGPIDFQPIRVQHGRIEALGFRVGGLAYLPDVSGLPDATWPLLAGLDTWVLDALRYRPHPTHVHLARSLEWIARAAPRRAVLTNLHNDLDYATLAAEVPGNVIPAHDGMVLDVTA